MRRRVILTGALGGGGLGCIILGIALIYPPAAVIAVGVALLALLTFDPDAARRLTWPR